MVDLLLATYNGERFLREQMDSILRQTVQEWRLIVHDDGSTDGTLDIIKSYAGQDERICLVDDGVTRLGVAGNFIHLLDFSTSEFVMFCDQDDIWLENKIEVMLAAISSKNNDIPQAVYSNAYLWNDRQGIISDRNTLTYPKKLEELLFLNTGIQGAAAIFNVKARQLLQRPLSCYAMHDHALTLVAMTFGEVDYIDQPLMYYRQHDSNVTGNAPGSLKNKLLLMRKHADIPVVDRLHYDGLKAFYREFEQEIPAQQKKIINVFLNLPSKPVAKRVVWIVKYRFKLFNSTVLLLLKMCLRKFCYVSNEKRK